MLRVFTHTVIFNNSSIDGGSIDGGSDKTICLPKFCASRLNFNPRVVGVVKEYVDAASVGHNQELWTRF